MFEDVHPPAAQWPDAPGAYLQLSEAYRDEAVRARELGWLVAERMSHHLAPLTHSAEVAAALHELLGQPPLAEPAPKPLTGGWPGRQ